MTDPDLIITAIRTQVPAQLHQIREGVEVAEEHNERLSLWVLSVLNALNEPLVTEG
jgi:hypothetical protein